MHALLTGETHTSADCSLMFMHAHNTQEGGGRHEYELGALNQSQPELITAAGSLQQQPGPLDTPNSDCSLLVLCNVTYLQISHTS